MVREQLLLPERNAFHPHYLNTIGCKLYQIIGIDIQKVLETAIADAKRDRTWLHIRLRFPADDPKYLRLTDYPWELLHNNYDFLAHQGVTFSRYIAYNSPRPNLPNVENLHVLLISSGAGDSRMGLRPLPDTERTAITSLSCANAQGLQQAQNEGLIQLEHLDPPTWNTLRTSTAGYTETNLKTAWREMTNEDIAASIIGFIRQATLGDALIPYSERCDRALKTILASQPWTPPQRKWLERIGKQLKAETIVDREALDKGEFKTQGGGFEGLNKVFGGDLENIVIKLHESIWNYPTLTLPL